MTHLQIIERFLKAILDMFLDEVHELAVVFIAWVLVHSSTDVSIQLDSSG